MNNITQKMETALLEAISRTVEDLAFEEIELISEAEAKAIWEAPQMDDRGEEISLPNLGEGLLCLPQTHDKIWAAVSLIAPLQGEIIIEVPNVYAAMMTEALFGQSEDAYSEDLLREALAEALNTLAGLFVKALIPANQEFCLGIPATGAGDVLPIPQTEAKSWYFDLNGHIITVTMTIGAWTMMDTADARLREVEV